MRSDRLGIGVAGVALGVFAAMTLALVALWLRSYFVVDIVNYAGRGRSGQVWFNNGQALVQMISVDNVPRDGGYWFGHSTTAPSANAHLSWWRRHGIDWRPGPMDQPGGTWDRVLTLPIGLVALVCGATPTWLLWRLRRRLVARVRRRERLCAMCGYDLRGTPQRCPECGHETETGEASAVVPS